MSQALFVATTSTHPLFNIVCPCCYWMTSSPTSFHCPLKNLLFNAFLTTHDVAKVAQLPLFYCVSKDEWGANVFQHPVVGSFILSGYPEKSSVAPQFKGLNPFIVIFCWYPRLTAVCGNSKHSCSEKSELEIYRQASAFPYVEHILSGCSCNWQSVFYFHSTDIHIQ